MVYAALGAICFTLVSKDLSPLGRRAEGSVALPVPLPLSRGSTDFLGTPACSRSHCLLWDTQQAVRQRQGASIPLQTELLEGRDCCAIR